MTDISGRICPVRCSKAVIFVLVLYAFWAHDNSVFFPICCSTSSSHWIVSMPLYCQSGVEIPPNSDATQC